MEIHYTLESFAKMEIGLGPEKDFLPNSGVCYSSRRDLMNLNPNFETLHSTISFIFEIRHKFCD